MKTAVILFLAALIMPICSAADSQTRFSCGYGHHGDMVPKDVRVAAIDRLNRESPAIAERLLGKEICDGMKITVCWSDGNTNGFETWFECMRSLQYAVGSERIAALHVALGSRYEELLSASKAGQDVPPLSKFLARYEKKDNQTP